MINCDKVVKFQKKDAELIDMLKFFQHDVRALEDAYTKRVSDVGEAWHFLIKKKSLTEEEWDKANKLYLCLMELRDCVNRCCILITDKKIDHYINRMLECKDESEDGGCVTNALNRLKTNEEKAMELMRCNCNLQKGGYSMCNTSEFNGERMCHNKKQLLEMAEWKDKAYKNDRENIRKHYMRFIKEFENKVEEWFLRNFCIHPHDGSVITGNFDQKFGSMDEFMDFAKKDMENNDYE